MLSFEVSATVSDAELSMECVRLALLEPTKGHEPCRVEANIRQWR